MKQTDQEQLLRQILEDGEAASFRAKSLAGGLDYLQRRHRRDRVVKWYLGAPALVALAILGLLFYLTPSRPVAAPPMQQAQASKPFSTSVKIISDEELFALFPGRAMALIGPRGHQEFVFLDQDVATQAP